MAETDNVITAAMTADPESITVAVPKLTKSNNRVKKKREPKADKARKAFDATPYGMRRSIRLVNAESIEYANTAAAKSSITKPTSPTPKTTKTTKTTICTTPKTDQRDKPCPSPLIPTECKNWYRIKGIINEASRDGKTSYLVQWEGYDPSTGVDWPAEWVSLFIAISPTSGSWALR